MNIKAERKKLMKGGSTFHKRSERGGTDEEYAKVSFLFVPRSTVFSRRTSMGISVFPSDTQCRFQGLQTHLCSEPFRRKAMGCEEQ